MNSLKSLHIFGEIEVKREVDEEVRVRVLHGLDWSINGVATPPSVGVMGGFELSLDHDITSFICSWPRLEISVGESRSSILIPAQPGSFGKDIILRYLSVPWWTLGLCDILEVTVTMHLITEC